MSQKNGIFQQKDKRLEVYIADAEEFYSRLLFGSMNVKESCAWIFYLADTIPRQLVLL